MKHNTLSCVMKKNCLSFLYRLQDEGYQGTCPARSWVLIWFMLGQSSLIDSMSQSSFYPPLLASSRHTVVPHMFVEWTGDRWQPAVLEVQSGFQKLWVVISKTLWPNFSVSPWFLHLNSNPMCGPCYRTHVYMDTGVCWSLSCVDCTELSKSI